MIKIHNRTTLSPTDKVIKIKDLGQMVEQANDDNDDDEGFHEAIVDAVYCVTSRQNKPVARSMGAGVSDKIKTFGYIMTACGFSALVGWCFAYWSMG
jgi:hypothetical protein